MRTQIVLDDSKPIGTLPLANLKTFKHQSFSVFEFVGEAQVICRGYNFNVVAVWFKFPEGEIRFYECNHMLSVMGGSRKIHQPFMYIFPYALENFLTFARELFPGVLFQGLRLEYYPGYFQFVKV